jgi:hypothetical protein
MAAYPGNYKSPGNVPSSSSAWASALHFARTSERLDQWFLDARKGRDAASRTDTYAALGPHAKQQVVGCMPALSQESLASKRSR